MEIHVHVHHHADHETHRLLERVERASGRVVSHMDTMIEHFHAVTVQLRELAHAVRAGEVPDDLYARLEQLASRTGEIADRTPNVSTDAGD
jgi:hypothetical protein